MGLPGGAVSGRPTPTRRSSLMISSEYTEIQSREIRRAEDFLARLKRHRISDCNEGRHILRWQGTGGSCFETITWCLVCDYSAIGRD